VDGNPTADLTGPVRAATIGIPSKRLADAPPAANNGKTPNVFPLRGDAPNGHFTWIGTVIWMIGWKKNWTKFPILLKSEIKKELDHIFTRQKFLFFAL
jgi:hypothetical protein